MKTIATTVLTFQHGKSRSAFEERYFVLTQAVEFAVTEVIIIHWIQKMSYSWSHNGIIYDAVFIIDYLTSIMSMSIMASWQEEPVCHVYHRPRNA
jgi:hypothetical protein